MAVNSSFKLQDEELSCPICFEEFSCQEGDRFPKLLLCLHTFCQNCVRTLRKLDGSLQCSICRTNHKIQHFQELLDNYVVVDYLKMQQLIEDEKLAKRLREEYDAGILEQERRETEIRLEQERIMAENVVDSASRLPDVYSVSSDSSASDENVIALTYRSASSSPEPENCDESAIEDQDAIQVENDYEGEIMQSFIVTSISDDDSTDEDGMQTAHSSINHFVFAPIEEPSEESNSIHVDSEIHSEITSEASIESDSEKQDSPTPQHLNGQGASNNTIVLFSSEDEDDSDNENGSHSSHSNLATLFSDEAEEGFTDLSDEGADNPQSRPQASQCSKQNSVNFNLDSQFVVRPDDCNMQ